jgi:hypothetical protein
MAAAAATATVVAGGDVNSEDVSVVMATVVMETFCDVSRKIVSDDVIML